MLSLGLPPGTHLPLQTLSPTLWQWVEGGEARDSVGQTAVLELAPLWDGALWGG